MSFPVAGEDYNITIQATDQGKPPKSANAIINLTVKKLTDGESLEERPRSTIERVKKKKTLIVNPYESSSQNYLADKTSTTMKNPSVKNEEKEETTSLADKDSSEKQPGPDKEPHYLPVGQMFKKNVYNLEVYENIQTPLVILNLGREIVGAGGDVGEDRLPIHFRIVGSNYGLFSVEEDTGQLLLTASPDREQQDKFILRVKVW